MNDSVYSESSGFPDSSVGKESTSNAGDPGSIPGSGRSAGEWKGYPLQYSRLENSMDCIHRKESDMTEWLSLFIHPCAVVTLHYNLLFMHLFPEPHCEFIDCSVSLESSPGLPDSRLSGLWNGWRKVKRAIKERETTRRKQSCGTQGNKVQIKAREVKSLTQSHWLIHSTEPELEPWASPWYGGECGPELLVTSHTWNVPGDFSQFAVHSWIFVSPCRKDVPQEGPDMRGALHR